MAANPFDVPTTSTATNPFNAAGSAGGKNPFNVSGAAAAQPSGFEVALQRTQIPALLSFMDRPRQASQAAIVGENPWQAFSPKGEDQATIDAIREKLREKLGDQPRYAKAPHAEQGLYDFGIDTATDPLSLVFGLGPLARGIPGVASGLNTAGGVLGRVGPTIAEEVADRAPALMRDVTGATNAVKDFFTAGGPAKRLLGESRFNKAIQAENRQGMREAEAGRRLNERYDRIIGGLNDEDKHTVFQILNGERQATDPASGRLIVPEHVAAAATQGRKLLNDAGALYASKGGRMKLAYGGGRLANKNLLPRVVPENIDPEEAFFDLLNDTQKRAHFKFFDELVNPKPERTLTWRGRVERPYEFPPELQEFAASPEQGLLGSKNIRANYLPGPHASSARPATQRPRPFNLLRPFAPNVIQRESFTTEPKDVSALEESFRNALEQSARQSTAGKLRQELGVPLQKINPETAPWKPKNLTPLEQLFERTPRAKGEARTLGERLADRWQAAVNIPKNTVTTIGLKHGLVNVPALALMSEGVKPAAEGVAKGVGLSRMVPGDRYEALRDAIEAGVLSKSPERENPIVDFLRSKPILSPLAKVSETTNALTWAIDDAAKQAVYRAKVARGEAPERAAAYTLREMVDYSHRSPFTEKILSKVAPFATFRSKIPGAVASSVARNPQRLLALDRATQGGGSSGRVGVNDKKATLTTPISDVVRGAENPFEYGRATLSDLVKLPMSVPGDIGEATGQLRPDAANVLRYMTYGHHVLPHKKDDQWRTGEAIDAALRTLPFGAGEIIPQVTGTAEWGPEDWLSILLGPSLGVHVR